MFCLAMSAHCSEFLSCITCLTTDVTLASNSHSNSNFFVLTIVSSLRFSIIIFLIRSDMSSLPCAISATPKNEHKSITRMEQKRERCVRISRQNKKKRRNQNKLTHNRQKEKQKARTQEARKETQTKVDATASRRCRSFI